MVRTIVYFLVVVVLFLVILWFDCVRMMTVPALNRNLVVAGLLKQKKKTMQCLSLVERSVNALVTNAARYLPTIGDFQSFSVNKIVFFYA